MQTHYNQAIVRELLDQAFNAGDLDNLAFDMFPDVYADFADGMTTSRRIRMIVAHAAKHGRFPQLLDYVRRENLYQYARYADRLAAPPANPQPILDAFQQRRLLDLQGHLQREYDLLRRYEEQLALTDDPRQVARIEREIARQQTAVSRYAQEAAELAGIDAWVTAVAPADLAAQVLARLDTLQRQIAAVETNLVAEHAATRAQMAQQTETVLEHFDAGQRELAAKFIERLDAQQLDLVERLEVAAAQRKITWREARALSHQLEMALAGLAELRAGQPGAEQYESLLAMLEASVSWEQKLKLTLPLIPGVLAVESEMAFDALGVLEAAWQRLTARFKHDA
jgi:hypothetical protein